MYMMSCLEETEPGGMLRSSLRIDDIDQLRLSSTEKISVIWVDISARPDLAALAVRSAPEPGVVICTWFYGNPGKRTLLIGLRIALKKPTPAVFTLLFQGERWAGHLSPIARYGKLWWCPGLRKRTWSECRKWTHTSFSETSVFCKGKVRQQWWCLPPHRFPDSWDCHTQGRWRMTGRR